MVLLESGTAHGGVRSLENARPEPASARYTRETGPLRRPRNGDRNPAIPTGCLPGSRSRSSFCRWHGFSHEAPATRAIFDERHLAFRSLTPWRALRFRVHSNLEKATECDKTHHFFGKLHSPSRQPRYRVARSSRSPLNVTSSVAPMSAAIAIHNVAVPASAITRKATFSPIATATFS